jgi:hypothetical protein
MKYMCLMILDETKYGAFSAADLQKLDDGAIEYTEMLQSGGHYVGASALGPTQSAVTVRVQNGKAVVTDGPFAETAEQVGGFFMVDARDLNEAIALASKMPCAYLGGIEIRPVREMVFSTDPQRRV